jgi:hypothetical protein
MKLKRKEMAVVRPVPGAILRFAPAQDDRDPASGAPPHGRGTSKDDFPYVVEMWDDGRTAVDQVLAVAVNGNLAFAAFYAAIREYPDRYITLRLNNHVLSRSIRPTH